jgi:hypothetical protein
MFGFRAFASRPFNALLKAITPPVPPVTWGKTGGIKKHEKIEKSKRAEIKESIKAIMAEPVISEAIVEELKEYVQPAKAFSIKTIDYAKIYENLDIVNRLIAKAREIEAIKQEKEDEALLLMLM